MAQREQRRKGTPLARVLVELSLVAPKKVSDLLAHAAHSRLVSSGQLQADPSSAKSHRRLPQVLLIAPAVSNTIPIPYTQGYRGISNSVPLSLGMVLLSSVSAPLPTGLVSGFASSSAAFNAIWSAAENTVPAGWTWSCRGEDLRIVRINLGTLFVPLALNYDTHPMGAVNQGRFTVDGSSTSAITSTPTFISNYLISTVLGLHHHAGSANTLQVQIVLQTPTSSTTSPTTAASDDDEHCDNDGTTIVVARREGLLFLARSLDASRARGAPALLVDINRTLLYVSQRFGVDVTGVWLYGAPLTDRIEEFRPQLHVPVEASTAKKELVISITPTIVDE